MSRKTIVIILLCAGLLYSGILKEVGLVEPVWGPVPSMDEVYAWRERSLVAILASGLGQAPADIMNAVEGDLPELAKHGCPPSFALRLLFPAFEPTTVS